MLETMHIDLKIYGQLNSQGCSQLVPVTPLSWLPLRRARVRRSLAFTTSAHEASELVASAAFTTGAYKAFVEEIQSSINILGNVVNTNYIWLPKTNQQIA